MWQQKGNVQQSLPPRSLSINKFILILALVIPTGNCDSRLENPGRQQNNPNIVYLFPCPGSKLNSSQIFHIPATLASEELIFGVKSTPFEGCTNNFLYSVNHQNDSDTTLATLKSTGFLQIGPEYYSSLEFCLQEWDETETKFQVCQPTCEGRRPCIAKCCSIGKSITYDNGEGTQGCTRNKEINHWKLHLFEDPWTIVSIKEWSLIEPHVSQKPPHCTFPNGTIYNEHESWPSIDLPHIGRVKMPMRLRKDGSLLRLSNERSWVVVPRNTFCIDDLYVSNVSLTENDITGRPIIVVKCATISRDDTGGFSIVYIVAMFTSALFLLITAVVYMILWDKLCTSVHGWTVLSYVTSMFFLYILLAISHTLGLIWDEWTLHYSGTTFCMFLGAVIHFFFISTFSFLTLINLDVWLTFRCHTPIGERSKGVRRFLLYNVFAYGLSTVVVGVGFILDHLYPDIESEVIVPQYGYVNCFLAPWALGYYVYSIIGVLLAINLIFIALTVRTIYEFRKTTTTVLTPNSSHQSFKLFLKIFIVCGLTWVFEIVSWLSSRENTKLHWVLLDCVNILQAIGIFAIFICKRKTIKQLQQKFAICNDKSSKYLLCCCDIQSNRHRSSAERSTGTTTTNSSTKQSSLTCTSKTVQLKAATAVEQSGQPTTSVLYKT